MTSTLGELISVPLFSLFTKKLKKYSLLHGYNSQLLLIMSSPNNQYNYYYVENQSKGQYNLVPTSVGSRQDVEMKYSGFNVLDTITSNTPVKNMFDNKGFEYYFD